MISKTTLSIAAGICGTIFLGYCIYFDRRRRNDPDFKKKLRERECIPLIIHSSLIIFNAKYACEWRLWTIKMCAYCLTNALPTIWPGRRLMKDRMKINPKMPNLNDHEAVQRFFIQEVNLPFWWVKNGLILLLFRCNSEKNCLVKVRSRVELSTWLMPCLCAASHNSSSRCFSKLCPLKSSTCSCSNCLLSWTRFATKVVIFSESSWHDNIFREALRLPLCLRMM